MKKAHCCYLALLALLIGVVIGMRVGSMVSSHSGHQNGSLFGDYVCSLDLENSPTTDLIAFPPEVLEDSRRMERSSPRGFEELICLYLTKHHLHYLRHFSQGYSFLSPDDVEHWESAKSDIRLYPVMKYFSFSGQKPDREDGLPSNIPMQWYLQRKVDGYFDE